MALHVCQGTLAVAGRAGLLGMALHLCRGILAVAGPVGLPGAGKLRRVQAAGMAMLRQSLKFPVADHQQDGNDEPTDPPRPGNVRSRRHRPKVEKSTDEYVDAPGERVGKNAGRVRRMS